MSSAAVTALSSSRVCCSARPASFAWCPWSILPCNGNTVCLLLSEWNIVDWSGQRSPPRWRPDILSPCCWASWWPPWWKFPKESQWKEVKLSCWRGSWLATWWSPPSLDRPPPPAPRCTPAEWHVYQSICNGLTLLLLFCDFSVWKSELDLK